MLPVLMTIGLGAMKDKVLHQQNADSIVTMSFASWEETVACTLLHPSKYRWTEWEWAPGTLLVWTHFDVSCNIYVLFLCAGQMESDLEPYLPVQWKFVCFLLCCNGDAVTLKWWKWTTLKFLSETAFCWKLLVDRNV